MHLVGLVVHLVTGIPWVAEFRDPLATHPDVDPQTPIALVRQAIERVVVTRAERIVWHDGIQIRNDYFETTYPRVSSDRWQKLPYFSFDPAAFKGPSAEYDEFVLTYAGSFYEGWIEPYTFLKGVGRYANQHEVNGVRVQFYGDWEQRYNCAAERAGIEDIIESHGFVAHQEVVPALKGSDVLVYIGGDDPRNELNVPSKIADYVAAAQPILAVVDPHFRVADLIEEHDLGIVVSPEEPWAIAAGIDALRTGEFDYNPDEFIIKQFDRERKTAILSDVLDDVAERRASGSGKGTGA